MNPEAPEHIHLTQSPDFISYAWSYKVGVAAVSGGGINTNEQSKIQTQKQFIHPSIKFEREREKREN
jgi:hypothetical protein